MNGLMDLAISETGGMHPANDIDLQAKRIALNCFIDALDDLAYEDTRHQALRWFVYTSTDDSVFSYGGFLQRFPIPHTKVRAEIKNRLKQGFRAYSRRSDKRRPVGVD